MSDFKDVRKILVIKLRYIGDVLLTTPVHTALRKNFPEASITALVNAGMGEVLQGNPNVDKVIAFDRSVKKTGFFSRTWRELSFLFKLRAMGFDMVVDLSSNDRSALMTLMSGARYRIGDDPRGHGFPFKKYIYTHLSHVDFDRHMVLQHLGIVQEAGIEAQDLSVGMHIADIDIVTARDVLFRLGIGTGDFVVVVQPTARRSFKCWPHECFARLIDALEVRGARVLLTGSGAREERAALHEVSAMCHSTPAVVEPLSLRQLAALIKQASLYVGLDSAPMHIAAAVGTPVIALFGPIRAFNWAPWYPDEPDGYSGRSGVQRVGPHTVVQKDWDCVPCNKEGCDRSFKSRCLDETEVDEVLRHVRFPERARAS